MLDSRGMPIADPMRDTASDTKDLKLAKSDSIVRARYTQQNNTTVINAKPGGDGFVVDEDGIVQRVEYSAAVAGGDPSQAKAFFESKHPLNFMQTVGHASGVQNPAEAVEIKSVEQAANRLKFMLKGPNGEIIEVSTDHVHAKSLMDPSIPPVEYFQMEADFEHRAVTGNIATAGQTGGIGSYDTPFDLTKIDDPVQGPKIMDALSVNYKRDANGGYIYKKDARGNLIRNPSGPGGYDAEIDTANPKLNFDNAFLDGRPSLHTVESLRPDSGFMKANAAELEKAKVAMRAVRDYSIGANDWVPAANKIAMSNFLLGHIPEAEASPSVQRQLAAMRAGLASADAGYAGAVQLRHGVRQVRSLS